MLFRSRIVDQIGLRKGLPPIDYDRKNGRVFIPLPGSWEIQTKGTTEALVLFNYKTRQTVLVKDPELADLLETIGMDIRTNFLAFSK